MKLEGVSTLLLYALLMNSILEAKVNTEYQHDFDVGKSLLCKLVMISPVLIFFPFMCLLARALVSHQFLTISVYYITSDRDILPQLPRWLTRNKMQHVPKSY